MSSDLIPAQQLSTEPSFDFVAFAGGIYGDAEGDIEIRAFRRHPRHVVQRFSRDLQHLQTISDSLCREGCDVYFAQALRIAGKRDGSRDGLEAATCVAIDIDTDKLGLDKDYVIAKLKALPFQPSDIVDSGHGLHVRWYLNEPLNLRTDHEDGNKNGDRLEKLIKAICRIVHGDEKAIDLSRILRVPGTFNYKEPRYCEVKLIEQHPERRYDISDLEDWATWQLPIDVGVLKPADDVTEEVNPYLAAAKDFGWKLPIDVPAVIKAMRPGNIHYTQLRVTASMVARGASDREITDLLLPVTMALGDPDWSEEKERTKLRGMIASACAKFGPALKQSSNASSQTILPKEPQLDSIVTAAKMVIRVWEQKYGQLGIIKGEMWTYDASKGIWLPFDDRLKTELKIEIQDVLEKMGVSPRKATCSAIFDCVVHRPELRLPGVEFDSRNGLIVGSDGAMDIFTGVTYAHSPLHYATRRIEASVYDRGLPMVFSSYLERVLSNYHVSERQLVIAFLQEEIGLFLVRQKVRELCKALMLYGPSRTGKTQLTRIIAALLGGTICSMTGTELAGPFGLMPFALGAAAWIGDDVFSQGGTLDTELFKHLVTGESITINIKGKPHKTMSLGIPVVLSTNHLPRIKDDTEAFYNRCVILPMNVQIPESEAAAESIWETVVREELGALLWWAREGAVRALERGRFDLPETLVRANNELRLENDPLQGFVNRGMELAPGIKVDTRDAYAAYQQSMADDFGSSAKTLAHGTFTKAVRQKTGVEKKPSNGRHFFIGLKLTSEGFAWADEWRERNPYDKSGNTGIEMNQLYHDDSRVPPPDSDPWKTEF